MIKFVRKTFRPQLNILNSHHFVSKAIKVPKDSLLGKKIVDPEDGQIKNKVLAGSIYPSNDAKALGVILNDLDITYGDANGALVTHGVVNLQLIPEAPTDAAKAALGQIRFEGAMNVATPEMILVGDKETVTVGHAEDLTVLLALESARWLPLAELLTSWVLSDAKAKLTEVEIKTEKLIRLTINVSGCGATGLSVKPIDTVTSAKKAINPLWVIDIVKGE